MNGSSWEMIFCSVFGLNSYWMITNLQYIMLNIQEKDVKLFDMPDTEEPLLDM